MKAIVEHALRREIAPERDFQMNEAIIARSESSGREDGQNHVTIRHGGKTLAYQLET